MFFVHYSPRPAECCIVWLELQTTESNVNNYFSQLCERCTYIRTNCCGEKFNMIKVYRLVAKENFSHLIPKSWQGGGYPSPGRGGGEGYPVSGLGVGGGAFLAPDWGILPFLSRNDLEPEAGEGAWDQRPVKPPPCGQTDRQTLKTLPSSRTLAVINKINEQQATTPTKGKLTNFVFCFLRFQETKLTSVLQPDEIGSCMDVRFLVIFGDINFNSVSNFSMFILQNFLGKCYRCGKVIELDLFLSKGVNMGCPTCHIQSIPLSCKEECFKQA